ncbi:MAG TPA: hypothetical protein PKG95_01160 [Anaerolineaceae bacterium]|nr:hypothetical protein [Anaerolineaceae bacterium]
MTLNVSCLTGCDWNKEWFTAVAIHAPYINLLRSPKSVGLKQQPALLQVQITLIVNNQFQLSGLVLL